MCGFKIFIMNLKAIFTWWNRQTFGTFLKTLFTGKYVGKDEFGEYDEEPIPDANTTIH